MTKAAFDKIKAGIHDMRRYLDGLVDKGDLPVRLLADSTVNPTSAQAQPPEKVP